MPPAADAPTRSTPAAAPLAAARDSAVVCDLSPLSVLAISGPDAGAFLQGQLSSDVLSLAEGVAQFT
jgi:folate-binding Fe-S cluster repair protein YgfZ